MNTEDKQETPRSESRASATRARSSIRKPKFNLPVSPTTILIVVLVAAVAFFGFQYFQKDEDPAAKAVKEQKATIEKVGKLIDLPKGEEPTIATVKDKDALQDQPFFEASKEGDVVLIYTIAKQAILYRPSENRLIEVAPINIDAAQDAQGEQSTTTTPE